MEEYYAHSLEKEPPEKWQRLIDHLRQTAGLAKDFAEAFNAGHWAYCAGILHDLGKYSKEFQNKLHCAAADPMSKEARRRVDHSGAGGRYAWGLWDAAGKILAYAIMGHHGGLPDGKRPDGSDLCKRLNQDEQMPTIPPGEIDSFGSDAKPERLFKPCRKRLGFQLSFFIRMVFSCLVDADFLDTERFFDPEQARMRRNGHNPNSLKIPLARKLASFKPEGSVNAGRAEILKSCIEAASGPTGIYTLTVPTGGGKTLSSLAFALEHAIVHGKRRVIYAIPYTSIIEQNAAVFRTILPEGSVLEHHSGFDSDSDKSESDDAMDEKALRHRLACENWDLPLVVTTNVQFFESLFANRTSKCRKLHNIADSVVILDEAQMLPVPYLKPCIEAIRELADSYGATVVLCTATQPALNATDAFPGGIPADSIREIVADPQSMHERFKRVKLQQEGEISDDELLSRIGEENQVLCVVNTRGRAARLFAQIGDLPGAYHLSARMCPAHRTRVLDEIREALKNKSLCRVISTQLVEAGVDVDFPVVYRELAGLDSIAQAAGRCNREGLLEQGKVAVFKPEGAKVPEAFRRAVASAESVLRRYDDPFCPAAMTDYFRQVYWLADDELDEKGILEDLNSGLASIDFPFKQIAEKFKMIETKMKPVIVPWDDKAERLVTKLEFAGASGPVLRRLQPYTVQIYESEFASMRAEGAIRMIHDRYPTLVSLLPYYDARLGIRFDGGELNPEDLVC